MVQNILVIVLVVMILSASIQTPITMEIMDEDMGHIVTSVLYLGIGDRVFYNTWIKHLQVKPASGINIYINYSPGFIDTVIFGNMYFRKTLVNPGYDVLVKTTTKTLYNKTKIYFEAYMHYLDNDTLRHIGSAIITIKRNTGNFSIIISAELTTNNSYLLSLLTYIINIFVASPLKKQVSMNELRSAVGRPKTIVRSSINATFYLNGTFEGLLQENTARLQSLGYDLTYNIIYGYPNRTAQDIDLDLQMLRELYVFIDNTTGRYAFYIINIISNMIYYFHDLSLSIHNKGDSFDLQFSTVSDNLTLEHWYSMIYTILTADGYSFKNINKLLSKLDIIENDLVVGNLSGAEKILSMTLRRPVFNTSMIIASYLSIFKIWSNLSLAFNIISTQNGSLYQLPDGRLINMTAKSISVKPYPTPLDAIILHMILNNERVLPQIAKKPRPPASEPGSSSPATTSLRPLKGGGNISVKIQLAPIKQLPGTSIEPWNKHDLMLVLMFLGVAGGIIIVIYIDKRRSRKK